MTALTSAEITALDHCGPVEAKTKIGTRLAALEAGTGAAYGLVGAMASAGIANSNAAGSATTAARIDHVHAANFGAAPDMAAGGVAAANAAGTAQKPARADHVHAVTAAAIPVADSGDKYTATNVETALAEVKTIADANMGVVKRTVTIGFADFSALTTEDTIAIDVGAVLPANARCVGHELVSLTPFNDGSGNPDVSIEVGIKGGDADAVVTSHNIGHDGAGGAGTSGVLGYPMAPLGAVTLAATVTTNNGAHLVALDAGAVTVNVFYIVLA